NVKCFRAKPHKSLLLLITLSRVNVGHQRLAGFTDYEAVLKPLLKVFNPTVKTQNCAYPVWWLQNDQIWEVATKGLQPRRSSGDPSRSELVSRNAVGGLKEEIFRAVKQDR